MSATVKVETRTDKVVFDYLSNDDHWLMKEEFEDVYNATIGMVDESMSDDEIKLFAEGVLTGYNFALVSSKAMQRIERSKR